MAASLASNLSVAIGIARPCPVACPRIRRVRLGSPRHGPAIETSRLSLFSNMLFDRVQITLAGVR